MQAPWPVTPRDVVTVGRSERLSDGSFFSFSRSIDHPRVPRSKKHVRSQLHFGTFWITPIPEGSVTDPANPLPPDISKGVNPMVGWCRVVYAVGADPQGSLPTWVVNIFNTKQPLVIARIGAMLESRGDIRSRAQEEVQSSFDLMRKAVWEAKAGGVSEPEPTPAGGIAAVTATGGGTGGATAAEDNNTGFTSDGKKAWVASEWETAQVSDSKMIRVCDDALRGARRLAADAVFEGETDGWKRAGLVDGVLVYTKANPRAGGSQWVKGVASRLSLS